jgi:hypothetical protein
MRARPVGPAESAVFHDSLVVGRRRRPRRRVARTSSQLNQSMPRAGHGRSMLAFRSVVSVLVSFVRSFSTNSGPALRAAAYGGRPRAGNDVTGRRGSASPIGRVCATTVSRNRGPAQPPCHLRPFVNHHSGSPTVPLISTTAVDCDLHGSWVACHRLWLMRARYWCREYRGIPIETAGGPEGPPIIDGATPVRRRSHMSRCALRNRRCRWGRYKEAAR